MSQHLFFASDSAPFALDRQVLGRVGPLSNSAENLCLRRLGEVQYRGAEHSSRQRISLPVGSEVNNLHVESKVQTSRPRAEAWPCGFAPMYAGGYWSASEAGAAKHPDLSRDFFSRCLDSLGAAVYSGQYLCSQ